MFFVSDDPVSLPAAEKGFDVGGRLVHGALTGFFRRPGDMRRQDEIAVIAEAEVGTVFADRFFLVDVDAGPSDDAGTDRFRQIGLICDASPAHVDQAGGVLS